MNLEIGCKEGQQYYLKNGEPVDRSEWTSLIMNHIIQNGNELIFDRLKATVNLWNKHDSVEEVAMHVYVSKYCKSLEINRRKRNTVIFMENKEDKGCTQLTLC